MVFSQRAGVAWLAGMAPSVLWSAKPQLGLLPPSASSLNEARSRTIAAMGAENSKPSSEVKQHVFSAYVHVRQANGARCPEAVAHNQK